VKILVTGKQGQLARALAEAGVSAAFEICLAGRTECDIRNQNAVERTLARIAPDLVVNTAAYTQVDQAESEPENAFAINAAGAANVARACATAGIPLIHLSTDYVFDGRKTAPYLETDETGALNVYGASKLEGERAVAQFCAQHIILRTSWVFSPWGQNFVRTMLRLAATRDAIDVVDDQYGCPTYAPHLADAILKIAETIARNADGELFGIYHAAGQGETTWYEFAGEIFSQAAKHDGTAPIVRPIPAAQYPTAARRPANSRLDCTKLRDLFGIALPGWQAGVEECVKRAEIAPRPDVSERRA